MKSSETINEFVDLTMDDLIDIRDAVLLLSENRNMKLVKVNDKTYVTRTNHHGRKYYTINISILNEER